LKGFYGDLKEVSAINPLGETGLSYCQCVAVAVSGCGVTSLDFQGTDSPTPDTEAADPLDNTMAFSSSTKYGLTVTGSATAGVGVNYIETGLGALTEDVYGDLSDEYNAVSEYIYYAGDWDPTDLTIDSQVKAETILAVFRSLPSKLDQCATLALNFIAA
jgi:hypothetical protein